LTKHASHWALSLVLALGLTACSSDEGTDGAGGKGGGSTSSGGRGGTGGGSTGSTTGGTGGASGAAGSAAGSKPDGGGGSAEAGPTVDASIDADTGTVDTGLPETGLPEASLLDRSDATADRATDSATLDAPGERTSNDAAGERDASSADAFDATQPDARDSSSEASDSSDSSDSGETCPLQDAYEPNDTAFDARGGVGDVNSCSPGYIRSLDAALFPTTDDDWYAFTSGNVPACAWHPRIRLTVPPAVDFDLYVYFKCKNGSVPSVTCGMGSTKVNGFDPSSVGCASANRASFAETVELTPSCATASDITVYVNVAHFNGRTCDPYTLSWGDD
jgi:hypothetical protein